MKLPTAQEMKNLDRSASEIFGIPSIVLMENAGLATVLMMEKDLGSCKDTFAPIFVGPGNNGGDGLVIGRHLHQRGCQPVFFFLVSPDKLKGDSKTNLEIIKNLKLPFHVIDTKARAETVSILFKQFESRGLPCYAIIDAIFGIGLGRQITGHFAVIVNLINKLGCKGAPPIVSVDTPSGMEADTGKVLGACVRADYTATYGCAKPGHFIHGSAYWTGKLEIIDIGIPPEAVYRAGISTELATKDFVQDLMKPLRRKRTSHKGTHGHLLILAGSAGKTGAAILSAKGALRSGAGLVSLAVPHDLNPIFETALPEMMTVPLYKSERILSSEDWPTIEKELQDKEAVVIGPGLGQDAMTSALVLKVYNEVKCPVIFDADALNILANMSSNLLAPAGPRIFTPHPGELSRLLGKSAEIIQDNRLDAALLGCDLFNNDLFETILILKGAGTVVAASDGSTIINTTGNPGMATAGMGDVLSGMIGAFICQGLKPKDAAIAAVYIHGFAGDILYREKGAGFYAGELADTTPEAIKIHLIP
jgi:NAD(P)H-hydrate epimerase